MSFASITLIFMSRRRVERFTLWQIRFILQTYEIAVFPPVSRWRKSHDAF